MKSPRSRRSSLIALLVVAAVGCDSDSPVAPTLPEGPVTPIVLYAAENSGLLTSERRVVRVQSELATLWADISASGPPPVAQPVVDFNVNMVLAVAYGQQSNGCYTIAITNASADGTDLTVTVTETEPGPGCLCTLALVEPVQVVQVPRADQVFFQEVDTAGCSA